MATVETVLEARAELDLTKQKRNTGSLNVSFKKHTQLDHVCDRWCVYSEVKQIYDT